MSNAERIAELQTEVLDLRKRLESEKDDEIRELIRKLMDKLVERIVLLKKGLL